MVSCPNCGEDVEKPKKSLKNQVFNIEAYSCKSCKKNFKVITEFIFSTEIRSVH